MIKYYNILIPLFVDDTYFSYFYIKLGKKVIGTKRYINYGIEFCGNRANFFLYALI